MMKRVYFVLLSLMGWITYEATGQTVVEKRNTFNPSKVLQLVDTSKFFLKETNSVIITHSEQDSSQTIAIKCKNADCFVYLDTYGWDGCEFCYSALHIIPHKRRFTIRLYSNGEQIGQVKRKALSRDLTMPVASINYSSYVRQDTGYYLIHKDTIKSIELTFDTRTEPHIEVDKGFNADGTITYSYGFDQYWVNYYKENQFLYKQKIEGKPSRILFHYLRAEDMRKQGITKVTFHFPSLLLLDRRENKPEKIAYKGEDITVMIK